MKKIYPLIVFTALFISVEAQTFNWAKREGSWAYDYGYGITNDNNGNVYVVGKYEEVNANFSDTLIPCVGNHDIYVAQYSSSGTLNWIRTAGGVLGDYATSIACDNAYLYVAGEIEGYGVQVTFVGTSTVLNSEGANDIFLAKYDLNGNLLWANRAGGVYNEKALGVAYDNAGNVFICGFYRDSATFGGTATIYGSGLNDIYLAKYDANGIFQWVKRAGSAGRDEAKSIQCDAAGNVYVCGMYENGCVFDSQTLSSAGTYFDMFLAKYATDGTLLWVKTAGSDYDEVGWSLAIDYTGNIYVAGEFNADANFSGTHIITSGGTDIFVASYDASGDIQWVKKAGGDLLDRARGIGTDGTNIYITGQFGNTAQFGPYTINAADSSDIFMAAINKNGTFLWAKAVGGIADSVENLGYESGNAICAFNSENVYATGSLLDGGVFGSTSFNEYGRTDVFIAKLSQADITAPTLTSLAPADNTVNAAKNSNLVIVFDESVKKGSGNIIIKEGGIIKQTIAVSGANVMVSGNTVTIDPADFSNAVSVNVEIAAGVFKDMSGNNYAGITSALGWNFTISNNTSIAELNTKEKIKIYPNPSGGNFIIDLTQLPEQKVEITILNYCGQLVGKKTDKSSSKINLDLSEHKKGIYIIVIKTKEGKFGEKIILQ